MSGPVEEISHKHNGSAKRSASETPSFVRLSVTISKKVAQDLADIRERDNATATDAVNRALATLSYFQKRIDAGARVLVEDEKGTYEIVLR